MNTTTPPRYVGGPRCGEEVTHHKYGVCPKKLHVPTRHSAEWMHVYVAGENGDMRYIGEVGE